jgi:hypothetical protein
MNYKPVLMKRGEVELELDKVLMFVGVSLVVVLSRFDK